ncbi:MAG: DUF3810 domain-containing protein [Nonlabens sp.]|uniref:DUF3810 domain-containing protein n=1 Tax=Nonlabens sp. TaxID=1888209 RepID=UPI003EF311D4
MLGTRKRHLFIAIGLLLLQIAFYYSLRNFPEFIETYYSNGIYLYISRAMRIGLGWIPFSFGDIMYGAGIIMILRWLWISKKEFITLPFSILLSRKRNKKGACAALVAVRKRYTQLFTALNIILLLFHFLWGFNYYRQPLNVTLNIEKEYSLEDLKKTVELYADLSNITHEKLQAVDSMPVAFERSQQELFSIASSGFEHLPQPQLRQKLFPNSIKESLLTMPLTHMGYSGYLNPITGEAQTNAWINCYKTPVLILHEMSHQLGFAKENEANYVAIYAGIQHEDPYFNYSAYIFGLRYLLNDLYKKDPEAFEEIKSTLRPGILKNYKELSDFWEPYNDGVIEQVSQATYNQYLKANNQPDGMKTYSYVVALLVNG